ncbi:DUF438 domain-containing protein [Ruminiclostridium josui]|uniref:DUF438 domain-containing protein n=1 Tax=Ruminiclostridium josui TaxID=1499 RepID=UPI000464D12F|nr:DUF438 domain-containing protein [Ruminiclostridium josui]
MSEVINNREYRQKVLKELISELHRGKSVDEVKERFEKLIEGVSPTEISEMEHSLMMEGMPVEEVQRLCDVHAAVFKGSIEEIHRPQKPEDVPGHPVHTFKLENKKIESLIDKIKTDIEKFRSQDTRENIQNLRNDFEKLWEIDKHYLRKENLLFPFMEKYQITAPPKVMWGVDDEIRDAIKDVKALLTDYSSVNKEQLSDKAEETVVRVKEMIFKEENILFPMVLETLSEDEWLIIEEGSSEIGYCLLENVVKWKPVKINVEKKAEKEGEEPSNNGYIKFDAGIMSPDEINAVLNTLPLDMTFVDKDGIVKYFTQGKERIFARTKAIIGREVKNCHPPASVHIVEKIVEDLSSGKKDHEDFWIRMGDKFVYIRYFAVRNTKGEYLGTIEVTQDIKPIQDITGEKRLASS